MKKLVWILKIFGFNPKQFLLSLKGVRHFFADRRKFKKLSKQSRDKIPLDKSIPCLHDRFEESGDGKGHYFNQDLLVAQKIFKNAPEKHLDIGSRIDGFVSHVASFREIEVLDIRKLSTDFPNIKFKQANMMEEIDEKYTNYCDSISSLHAIEHFGLGRYGDPVDPEGHLKGLNNIYKILKKGGILYFSVPLGKTRVEFNAHRVFSIDYCLDYFNEKFTLKSFSYVDDEGSLHNEIPLEKVYSNTHNNFNCTYGCGIYELVKK